MQSTQWSVVGALRSPDEAERKRAHETLARTYWPAIYAYLRRSGYEPGMAEELTQGFFADVVYGRRLIEQADSGRGRLRSLMLTALKRYLIDGGRRAGARPDTRAVPIDGVTREEVLLAECPSDGASSFDARWRALVLEQAIASCRAWYETRGKPNHWIAFEARYLRPATGHVAPTPYRELAATLGFVNEAAATAAVQAVRDRLYIAISEIVAGTVDPEDFEDELAFVRGGS